MQPDKAAARERLKLAADTPVFVLLAGSQVNEINQMAPIYFRTAQLVLRELPNAQFISPYPTAAARARLQHFLAQPEFEKLPIRLQAARTELACAAADAVLVTSGTATLEVALCKRPMVISYKLSALTYWLVKRKIQVPHVGLPNILLNKAVVPELLQADATPEKLAAALLDWYPGCSSTFKASPSMPLTTASPHWSSRCPGLASRWCSPPSLSAASPVRGRF